MIDQAMDDEACYGSHDDQTKEDDMFDRIGIWKHKPKYDQAKLQKQILERRKDGGFKH